MRAEILSLIHAAVRWYLWTYGTAYMIVYFL